MPTITIRGLSKRFDDIVAAEEIDLEVKDREYLIILGPTGAGKTTLLRMIAGLTEPDGGSIYMDGRRVDKLPPEEREAVYLSQTYALFKHMTVWQNTIFGPSVKGWKREDMEVLAREMLGMVRLMDRSNAYPQELSGGMQQRSALARALATNVKTLLLDEPLRALDARLRLSLRSELRSLSKDLGITTLHVTHDQEEAITMADRIVMLRRGKIEQVGSPMEIYEEPANPFIMHFVGEANFLLGRVVDKTEGWTKVRVNERTVTARASDLPSGSECCIGIKAEKARMMRRYVENGNNFVGTVERSLFLGRLVSFEIAMDDGSLFKAKVPSLYASDFRAGDKVSLRFDPKDCIVFPIPEGGLERELEVE